MFTKKKFLSFTTERQHKKSAELLRIIYDTPDNKDLCIHYNEMQYWMGFPELHDLGHKVIADRYHEHLQKAKINHREHNLLPAIRRGDKTKSFEPLPVSIYLDNIRSAHNIGSIIRTTEALSLGELHFSTGIAFAENKQVKDAAMGAQEWVRCHKNATINTLPAPVIAVETAYDAISINDFIFPQKPFTLAIGNEEYGCSDETLERADIVIEIPLCGRKNSLNVANAFAIIAHEIHRQRRLT